MLTSGGDRRISVPRGGNTNIYGASPFPRSTLGYSASTANDISLDAFRHLAGVAAGWPSGSAFDAAAYRETLEQARRRIRAAWGMGEDIDVVFAPSGTDLEFVALALAAARSGRPVTNILLGQDEVGSGCGLAASGRYFAGETALAASVVKGAEIEGLADTALVGLPVRDPDGAPLSSMETAAAISEIARHTVAAGGHTLAHVVHGSKTGLILPEAPEIEALRRAHGEALSLVVDACQARIEAPQLRAYLAVDAIVLLTGSKFMGGPPFSGFALVPRAFRPAVPLAAGLAKVFRRAEWPLEWAACDHLPASANPGLALRIEAALFELERYDALSAESRDRVIARFGGAVHGLAARLGVSLVAPALAGSPIHQSTLATLDLSSLRSRPGFAVAQRWCRVLAARGLRLGQPVRCVRGNDGDWAGTLRISLSMPLITSLAGLGEAELSARFAGDMAQIADVLEAAQRPVAC